MISESHSKIFDLYSLYDSKVINFKTPNILIIFSNEQPCTTRVSIDRWSRYKIINDELEIFER